MLKKINLLISLLCPIAVFCQHEKLARDFADAKNDSVFIVKNSQQPYRVHSINLLSFPGGFGPLDSMIFNYAGKERVVGPLIFGNQVVYGKIISIDSAYRIRVGNIWLSPEKYGADKGRKVAEQIVLTVKNSGDFDAASKKYTDDGNQNFEADLGWTFASSLDQDFVNEVLKHKKGECFIAFSQFGTHVVKCIDNPVYDRQKVQYVLLYLERK